ncbi:MAG TPA: apolipoprotein N-acyltransferase [Vicinamibacterales bacterium]|nr:apolipoprotein N-acyltransferase [Vicinamibacterales bacterium]
MQAVHYALALLTGALLALSFPRFGHPAAAWIALAPLLVAIGQVARRDGGARRAAVLGFASGAVYFGGTVYWVAGVMATYGGLARPAAAGVAALLVGYLALYPALFALATAALVRAYGSPALLLAPAVWVATELARAHVWSGFPWVLLGYSQAFVLPVAQVASLVGVYGLSMLVAAVGAALAFAAVTRGRLRWVPALAAIALVAIAGVWGAVRLREGTLRRLGTPIRVAVVQGNIDQADKWNPALREAILQRYIDLSRRAIARDAGLVIWPEASLPFLFEREAAPADRIRRLAREGRTSLLVGGDDVDLRTDRYYNAAFLVAPDGRTAAVYRKIRLVPFGEYVPLRRLLFFVDPLVEAVSDFSPGDEMTLLPIDGHRASTAICYEAVYPGLVDAFVDRGSELLTTITNDAWFGRSSAAYQHFQQAALRAVEQGRYLARAANTGISGFVDPYGRVLASTGLFETRVLVADLRLLRGRTLYGRLGDLAAYAGASCVVLALGVAVLGRRGPARGRWPDRARFWHNTRERS